MFGRGTGWTIGILAAVGILWATNGFADARRYLRIKSM